MQTYNWDKYFKPSGVQVVWFQKKRGPLDVWAISLRLKIGDSMPSCMDIKMWPPTLYLSPCSHLAVTQQGVCSRFRAMQTSSNITALPTSSASLGGCKGSHMPFPKLLPKYIFNKAAARVFLVYFFFCFFSVRLGLMNKTEKSRSNSLLIYRVQESKNTSCLCYNLWAWGSSAAELPMKLSEQRVLTASAWARWGASLLLCRASSTCHCCLGSAGLWRAKWHLQSTLSILSSLHASKHLDIRTALCFHRDVRNVRPRKAEDGLRACCWGVFVWVWQI